MQLDSQFGITQTGMSLATAEHEIICSGISRYQQLFDNYLGYGSIKYNKTNTDFEIKATVTH